MFVTNLTSGSFKNQFKKADKSGAEVALILGEEEIKNQTVTVKFLRKEQAQQTLSLQETLNILRDLAG